MTNRELSLPRVKMEKQKRENKPETDDPTEAKVKTKPSEDTANTQNGFKRKRTSEDFYLFCTYVLAYENYDTELKDELRSELNPSPPLDSSASSVNSESSQEDKPCNNEANEGDSYDLVTCFCGKPFAGRPMIECSLCLTWIHLSCARIRKSHIPEVFHCSVCKSVEKEPLLSPSLNSAKRSKRST